MKVFIDADACPVKSETITAARQRGLSVVMVANDSHSMTRYETRKGIDVVKVGSGQDAADFAVIERLESGDVVVTQDIGLAAMVLGRGARAVSPRGRIFYLATIDAEMDLRHAEAKHRRGGGRTRGPAPFTEDDREHFQQSISRMLDSTGDAL